jgi:hypothetical protein
VPEYIDNAFLNPDVETRTVVEILSKKRKASEIDDVLEYNVEQSDAMPNATPSIWVFFFEKPVNSSLLNRANGLPFVNKLDVNFPLGMLAQSEKALLRLKEHHRPSEKAKDGDIAIICWRSPNKSVTPVFFIAVLKKQNKINKSLLIDHFFSDLEHELPERFAKSGNEYYDPLCYTWMGISRVREFRKEDNRAFSLDEIFGFRGLSLSNKPFPKTTSFFLSGDIAQHVASFYNTSTNTGTLNPVLDSESETESAEEESEGEQRFKQQKVESPKASQQPSLSFQTEIQSEESWMINHLLQLDAETGQQEMSEFVLYQIREKQQIVEEQTNREKEHLNVIAALNAKQSQNELELEKRKLVIEEREKELERKERELANKIENVQQQNIQLAIQEQSDKCLRETRVKQRQEDLKFQLSLEKTRERAQLLQDLRHEIQTKDGTIEKLQLSLKQQETSQDAFKTRVANLFLKISEKLNHHRLVNNNLNLPFVSDEEHDSGTFLSVSPFELELKESISNLFLDFVGKNSAQFKEYSDGLCLKSNTKYQLTTEIPSLIADSQEELTDF